MRSDIETPALVLDVDALQRNIERMAGLATELGFRLRPHAKTHKCPEIARRQVDAGAIGVCCQTLDEAMAMAKAEIPGILVTSPQPSYHQLKAIRTLLEMGADVSVVVDDENNIRDLQAIASGAGRKLPLVVDFDVGVGRAGVFSEAAAIALVAQISNSASLCFKGVQGYYGNLQQVTPLALRQERAAAQAKRLRALLEQLAFNGFKADIVTGGGTGTFAFDAGLELFTELQPGSYVFLDSCYGPLDIIASGNPFEYSLYVAASVVSVNRPGGVIVNAGFKAFATDSGLPRVAAGADVNGTYKFMGDEHGAVDFPSGDKPKLGSTIEFIPSHVDPTVSHFDSYAIVSGSRVVGHWKIATPRFGYLP